MPKMILDMITPAEHARGFRLTGATIPIYNQAMPQEKLKQVAVRMSPRLHKAAVRMAKREDISFGELVRRSVLHRINNSTGYGIAEKGHVTR